MNGKIAFIHPDLGIGGAEQLIVNLCLAGRRHGYEPHIYTPYHHKSFPETHDGTIIVHQHGSFFGLIPDTILGKLKGLLAYIRCIICVLWLLCFNTNPYSAVIVDQVSVVLPILKFFRFRTIFYCHYPDKLLAGKRGFFKKIYRFFIDLVEELSLFFAEKIYVNSQFTKDTFYQNFGILKKYKVPVEILYPCVDLSKFDEELIPDEETNNIKKELNCKYLFSLNRYERKKNINLAIEAFADLLQAHPELKDTTQPKIKLVIAGGYDLKVRQNIEHLEELKALARKCSVEEFVVFYVSISNEARKYLLRNTECVLYTPQNQHFGIVPCEAMYSGVPIIADNSGGPKQSVGEGCGFLCANKQDWAINMWKVLRTGKQVFIKGRQQVIEKFSIEKFSDKFVEGIESLSRRDKTS